MRSAERKVQSAKIKQDSSAKPTPATHQRFSHQRINVYGIMSQKENGKSFKVSKTGE
jgi:hypothetical protein